MNGVFSVEVYAVRDDSGEVPDDQGAAACAGGEWGRRLSRAGYPGRIRLHSGVNARLNNGLARVCGLALY